MDMKKMLAATALAAFVAGTNLAAAQSAPAGNPTGAGKSGPSPSAANPAGATRDDAGTPGMGEKPAHERTGQGDVKKGTAPKNAQKGDPGHSGDAKPGAGDAQKSTQRDESSSPVDGNKGQRTRAGDKTTGVGGSGALTGEKRARIKETIVKSGNAPRVTNVNFSISVGTTVPRSVRLAAVPATVIEIYPAWRGFSYFLVGDEIVIVDPDTMQIVAVIEA